VPCCGVEQLSRRDGVCPDGVEAGRGDRRKVALDDVIGRKLGAVVAGPEATVCHAAHRQLFVAHAEEFPGDAGTLPNRLSAWARRP
jgi:hypothetical protein